MFNNVVINYWLFANKLFNKIQKTKNLEAQDKVPPIVQLQGKKLIVKKTLWFFYLLHEKKLEKSKCYKDCTNFFQTTFL